MSQTDPHTTTIGDREYTVYRLPPKVAWDHTLKLGKVLGPSLGHVLEAFAKGPDGEVDIAAVIGSLMDRIDIEHSKQLRDEFAKRTTVAPGGKLNEVYAAVFGDNPTHQFKWFAFAMKVQFSDFLSEWAGDFDLSALLGGSSAQESPTT